MIFCGIPPDQARKTDQQVREKLRKDKITLLTVISDACLNPAPNPRIGALLKAASPTQIAAIRKHLQARQAYWSRMTARIEAANVERAIQALDEGRYDYGHIGSNLDDAAIGRLFRG